MVELCSAMSGEVVAQLAAMELEEKVVKELKRHFGWTTRTYYHLAVGRKLEVIGN